MVCVPFVALLLYILQAALIFFAASVLETFGDNTARGLMTGSTQQGSLTPALFKVKICNSLPSLFSCGRLWVDVASASSFAEAPSTTVPTLTLDAQNNVTTAWGYNPGTQGDIVVIRMAYMWPVVAMPMRLSNVSSTAFQLTANSVMKTEKYQ